MKINFLSCGYLFVISLLISSINFLHAGHIKALDITEKNQNNRSFTHRVVNIDFEEDPGDIDVQFVAKDKDAITKIKKVKINWHADADAESLADLAGMTGPTISDIGISGIRNVTDLQYANVFFNKIKQYSEDDILPSFVSSNKSRNKWKLFVEKFQDEKIDATYKAVEAYEAYINKLKEDEQFSDED
ncbi:MAG: hypothetical protein K2W92_06275 [Alphaproteobacteria bacterium]|nr:hypothetical protein [Alphaproteobacteria bacterium]MBY0292873.1 hypothetical protein [Alphaproteobacteria bacterium]